MPVHDGLDNPGSDPGKDAFNRWPFSKRLAETIAEFDTSNGAPVIGIFGKWGYGKSTVLNYIKRELETNHSDKVVLFEFNPWLFGNEDELIAAFLIGLTSSLKVSLGNRWKDFGKLLDKGSGLFGMIPFVGSGAQKLTESIGKEIAKDSLQSQRKRAVEVMRNATHTVVVLIDDLDRLEPQEALTMLRLVRLNANFPRVIYVLAFDDAMVAKAAGTRYGDGLDSGRQFLEKIVQYPFTLPAVGLQQLVQFVLQHARDACSAANVGLSEEESETFQRLVDLYLSRRLSTPRQAIRYANALRFALPLLKGEVNTFDQMLVEGLRVLFPEVYLHLRDDVRSITRLTGNGTVRVVQSLREHAERLMRGSTTAEIASAIALIETLFGDPTRLKSIAQMRYFDRYFSYAVAADDLSDSLFLPALRADRDAKKLADLYSKLTIPRPEQLIYGLAAFRTQLDPEELLVAAEALARNGQRFISKPDELLTESTLPSFDPLARQMVNLLVQMVFDLPQAGDWRERAITTIIDAAEPLPMAIVCHRQLRNLFTAIDRGSSESKNLWEQIGLSHELHRDEVTDGARHALTTSIDRRLRAFAEADPKRMFGRDADGRRLLYEWASIPGRSAGAWLEGRFVTSPADAMRFLKLLRRERDGWGWNFHPASALIAEPILRDALQAYVARPELDPGFSADDLALAQRFIADHTPQPTTGQQQAETL